MFYKFMFVASVAPVFPDASWNKCHGGSAIPARQLLYISLPVRFAIPVRLIHTFNLRCPYQPNYNTILLMLNSLRAKGLSKHDLEKECNISREPWLPVLGFV